MKKTFYEKKGNKYIPIREYDSDFWDASPYGTHITVCKPGHKLTRYNIIPEIGPLLAAGILAEDAITKRILKASEERPTIKELTKEQLDAYHRYKDSIGGDGYLLELPSAREIAEEAVYALIDEAQEILKNPAVKKAWDHFLLTARLANISDQ